ncbi:conserved Plasmodium protein, unknown function [Plasmodium berghei]|uniref:Helicase, putative n=2 Tax=Plasmodium berghei TaxID=5821 RepID=A0A509AR24_PLABA|nr:helicase, putative [Plasmodium berghei ANKA]CXJ25217.1 conserved Plasmodium protein, unknown function [Plasmodium berghei]SCM26851.1 conserved Plasmodium protein, unknown function [Plasmodium berghei]SCN28668.1 conserved Plasmodium protein, unknown function [Plasmodium berghei]SCO64416.1 conserved Plasmodium protein, unknown function [Plasmodium berghei]VUC58550.1 helicase, putative [Plasmodium berghei ANKA]|eukprot:XP_034424313.1 helicase, putative [Plasmodium berghei ANKA]
MHCNTVKRTYECLYTHQKTQKNKKWKDGYCEILISYGVTKIYLLNSNRICVESFISNITNFESIEEEIELSNNLVQFVDIYNYVESEITNEIINDDSRKRGSEFSKEHDNTHSKKIKKKHEAINFNKNYQIKREELLRPKEILVPSKRIDKYAHTNRKFEVPRKIEPTNDKSKDYEQNELDNMDNEIIENIGTQFTNINKESYISMDKKNMTNITYTTTHLFNKKNTTKWYDGYIVDKENEIELYNFLEEKLFVKKKENIIYDEYMSFGTYIVYNDFLNKPSSGSNNILETSNFIKKNKFNKNLHNVLKCGISKNSSINVKKLDEKEFQQKIEYYKNSEHNLGIENRIFSNPRKRNFVFSKENNNYDNIIHEGRNQNNLENFSEKYNEQIKDSSINKKNGSIHITNKNECELHFYTNYDCDKDEKKKNTKIVFFSGNRENCNKYEEIVNIGQVVSKNHFSHINVFNNSMKIKLNDGLINYDNKDRNIENDNKFEQLDNINRLSSSLENTKHSDNPKKDYSNTNNEKYNGNYEKNTYNLLSNNYNENIYLENGNDQKNNSILTKKDTSLHVLEAKTILETDKKITHLISEQNLYCDIYKINNIFSFSNNNNSFCINDTEHINRNNLFLPVYIIIPKKKEDIKNKLNELPYFKIPNFFVNKSEYILCFMNATLFQIYYEITNKFIYIYDNLIYALKDDMYKKSNLKSVNENINTKNKDLTPISKMNGISTSSITTNNTTNLNFNEEYKKKNYKNNTEDNYILLLENVELVYSLQDGNTNKYGKGTFLNTKNKKNTGIKYFLKKNTDNAILIEKNGITHVKNNIKKYININHIIIIRKKCDYGENNVYTTHKDALLLFTTKWNGFKNNYLEIFPLNFETFVYICELFEKEKNVLISKEFLYFLKKYKSINFQKCLFFIKMSDHLDNLKHLFYFYKNIEEENIYYNKKNIHKNINYMNNNEKFIYYNFVGKRMGVKDCIAKSYNNLIPLNNVNIEYKNELIQNLQNNKKLNKKQKEIIQSVINWFEYKKERVNDIDNQNKNKQIEQTSSCILVNGIFGSGKSTLICNIIMCLDKILGYEEKLIKDEKKQKKKESEKGHTYDSNSELYENTMPKYKSLLTKIKEEEKSKNSINEKQKKKIILMCNTNFAVDNILLKLKRDFEFYDFSRIGTISEINPFLITNFISITSKEETNAEEIKNYLEKFDTNTVKSNNFNDSQNEGKNTNHAKNVLNKNNIKWNNDDKICDIEKSIEENDNEFKQYETSKEPESDRSNPSINNLIKPNKIHKITDINKLIEVLKKEKKYMILKNKYKNKRVIAGTCKSLYIFEKLNKIKDSINYLIADECTQIDELTLLKFFIRYPIKKIILIGDIMQLGFVMKSKSDLCRSLFSRLIENELFIKYFFIKQFRNCKENKEIVGNYDTPNLINAQTNISVNTLVDQITKLTELEYSNYKSEIYEQMFNLHYENCYNNIGKYKQNNLYINKLIIMNKQYRCHPDISNICSHLFYNNYIKNAKCTEQNTIIYDKYNAHLNFILIRKEYKGIHRNSYFINTLEANIILNICDNMISNKINPDQIGIISLFRYQSIYIQNKMKLSKNYDILKRIKVSTVDSFQGIEKEIILFSCVLSFFSDAQKKYTANKTEQEKKETNVHHNSQFFSEKNICTQIHKTQECTEQLLSAGDLFDYFCENKNRINVALSRSRNQLIIVAHQAFVQKNKIWSYIKSKSKIHYYD